MNTTETDSLGGGDRALSPLATMSLFATIVVLLAAVTGTLLTDNVNHGSGEPAEFSAFQVGNSVVITYQSDPLIRFGDVEVRVSGKTAEIQFQRVVPPRTTVGIRNVSAGDRVTVVRITGDREESLFAFRAS